MFWPIMMGIAAPKVICPVEANACRIPTEAEEDWIMAVSTAPATTPRMGLVNMVRILRNSGTSFKPATAPDIMSMPNINVANPSRMVAVSFFLLLEEGIMYNTMPIKASTGVKDMGFSSCTNSASPSIPLKLSSHAVTVVPTLAPIITLMACFRLIIPELTKPTTITVVAEED